MSGRQAKAEAGRGVCDVLARQLLYALGLLTRSGDVFGRDV